MCEEDVGGGEVTVDDGRVEGVEIQQSCGHVTKNGEFHREGNIWIGFQTRLQIRVYPFHYETQAVFGNFSVFDANKLDDVGMAKLAVQNAFANEFVKPRSRRLMERLVRFLSYRGIA